MAKTKSKKALEIEVLNLLETQKKLEQVAEDLAGAPVIDAMKKATLIVQRDAKRFAPVDTGRLRASLTPTIETQKGGVFGGSPQVRGIVGSNVKYAPYMEFGTKPHWPPLSALEVWARRHGTTAYAVARGIAQHGTKAREFLQKSVEINEDKIKALIKDAIEGIVSK